MRDPICRIRRETGSEEAAQDPAAVKSLEGQEIDEREGKGDPRELHRVIAKRGECRDDPDKRPGEMDERFTEISRLREIKGELTAEQPQSRASAGDPEQLRRTEVPEFMKRHRRREVEQERKKIAHSPKIRLAKNSPISSNTDQSSLRTGRFSGSASSS